MPNPTVQFVDAATGLPVSASGEVAGAPFSNVTSVELPTSPSGAVVFIATACYYKFKVQASAVYVGRTLYATVSKIKLRKRKYKLTVQVRAPAGAPVIGAVVTLTAGTATAGQQTTPSTGNVVFSLYPGTYNVAIEAGQYVDWGVEAQLGCADALITATLTPED